MADGRVDLDFGDDRREDSRGSPKNGNSPRKRHDDRSRSRSPRMRTDLAGKCPKRLWIGNLPHRCDEGILSDEFGKFGKIIDVKVVESRNDTYGFVEYEKEGGAADAVRSMDQTEFRGQRLIKVGFANKERRERDRKPERRDDDFRRRDRRSRSRSKGRQGERGAAEKYEQPPPAPARERGNHRLVLEGLPPDMSWKELKDLGMDYGPSLRFTRTWRHPTTNIGMGLLEYRDRVDFDSSMKGLNGRRIQGCQDRLKCYEDRPDEIHRDDGRRDDFRRDDRREDRRDDFRRDDRRDEFKRDDRRDELKRDDRRDELKRDDRREDRRDDFRRDDRREDRRDDFRRGDRRGEDRRDDFRRDDRERDYRRY